MILNAYLYSLKKGKSLSLVSLLMYIRSLVKVTFFFVNELPQVLQCTLNIKKEAFFLLSSSKTLRPPRTTSLKIETYKNSKDKEKVGLKKLNQMKFEGFKIPKKKNKKSLMKMMPTTVFFQKKMLCWHGNWLPKYL